VANNFGFNIGGGSGGIANLVQAPKVTPVRTQQFAPTPQRRVQRDEKDPKKQILGALLGASSPFLAEAGLAGLAKIPGLEDKIFKPEPAVRDEFGITDPVTGAGGIPSQVRRRTIEDYNQGRPLTDDQYEALEDAALLQRAGIGELTAGYSDPVGIEEAKLRRRVERALPSTKLPRQKTLLGKGLSELLTYAPAIAMAGDEDDGSVAAYISAAQSGKKLEGALDEQRLKAYLDRETKRGETLTDIGDFTRKISYSAVLQDDGTFAPIKRTALISPDKSTRYVLSQGNPAVDFVIGEDGSQVPVPKGQYFIRESLTLDDTDPGKPEDVKLFDTNSGQIAYGTVQYAQTPSGREARILLKDPRNRRGDSKQTTAESLRQEFGDNWVPYDQELAQLDAREKGDAQLVKKFDARMDREVSTFEVANIASTIIPIAMEAETKPELLTNAGALPGFFDQVRKEINSVYNIFNASGNPVRNVIYDSAADRQSAVSMSNLLLAANNFSQIQSNSNVTRADVDAARDQLVSALKVVQARAKEQGASGSFIDMNLDSAGFQDLIEKRGLLAAGQLRLAYAAAAADGQTGTSLSDRDVTNFLSQLGFGDTNAKLIGKKMTNFVVNRFQMFDEREFRNLSNNARNHSEIDIRETDNYLSGTFGVSRSDLNALRDPKLSQEDKEDVASKIQERIAMVTRGSAAPDFVYDRENQRIRYVPILERLKGRELLYNRYMQDIFPHYGITEDQINLVGGSDIDLGSTGRRTRTTVTPYQPRIRVPNP